MMLKFLATKKKLVSKIHEMCNKAIKRKENNGEGIGNIY